MPGLARKVVICAAVDGLILQPHSSRKEQRPSPPYQIRYGDAAISAISRDVSAELGKANASFEAFGIVGLITVSRSSYLVSIIRRQQVALLRGVPIYVVSEVAITPCTSQNDALAGIARTNLGLAKRPVDKAQDDSGSDSDAATTIDDDTLSRVSDDVGDDADLEAAPAGGEVDEEGGAVKWGSTAATANTSARSSVAEDVIGRRGSYGRFAQRWFSKSGWKLDQKRVMGLSNTSTRTGKSSSDEGGAPGDPGTKLEAATTGDGKEASAKKVPMAEGDKDTSGATRLLPRLLRTAQILFGTSRSFYFAYDCDITRSLANPKVPATALQPLHNHVEPLFFWNHHVLRPFIDAGADALAMPLMEGFVGQRSFVVDSQPPQSDEGAKGSLEMSDFSLQKSDEGGAQITAVGQAADDENEAGNLRPSERSFDITVISRRSIKRAGLRYLRRGIDDEGFVANSVETEQILAPTQMDEKSKVYSFVQIRGSIPVFFTQSPYSLKPMPVLMHTPEANIAAMRKHFEHIRQRYGELQLVNLVEKHGPEAIVGKVYEDNVAQLNKDAKEQIPFEWWDFHAETRGMKFENVSKLVEILSSQLDTMGSTVEAESTPDHPHAQQINQQKGVVRTNCMDCLDRTNVGQSSFARYMLESQLKAEGFDLSLQRDQVNSWFNTLWADNGDAISKQYASTAAMKGDYTRTKKRNYRGALTDAGLGLSRFYNGMVNDFFLQASLDFLLGNVTALVFEEFEATMMTKDPAVSITKMREQAIETSQKRVIADESEEFVGGWTLLTPHMPDNVRSHPLEEAVLLLTDVALYLCRFDWNLDKVSSFERVELAHVLRIKFGTYITHTNTPAQMDENRNVGLVVTYNPGLEDVTRVNTRSMSSTAENLGDLAKRRGPAPSGLAYLLARGQSTKEADPAPRRIALKALSQSSAVTVSDDGGSGQKLTEIQQVVSIVADIERLVVKARQASPGVPFKKTELHGTDGKDGEQSIVERGDIISLEDAKKSTGYLESLGHTIKRLVWA